MVRPGDTLTSIARTHGTTARSIAFWNRSRYPSLDPDSPTYSPNRIEVGWELVLIPDVELDPEELPEPSPSTPPPSADAGAAAGCAGRQPPARSMRNGKTYSFDVIPAKPRAVNAANCATNASRTSRSAVS